MKSLKKQFFDNKKPKLTNFSKLITLRERWNDKNLSIEQLRDYNKWSVVEKFKIVEIELRLEHYLCKNILVDLNGKDDLFSNIGEYFSSKNLQNGWINKIVENLGESKNRTIYSIKKLTFGSKVILWNSLKKTIFKNKFMGIDKKDQKQIITALNNVRNIRNGIAHMESKKQIYAKLKMLNASEKISKKQIHKKSIAMCKKIQHMKVGIENE